MKPKNQLIRIVNNVNGVSIDISGKANGRGVYLCKCKSCIEKALKNKNSAQYTDFRSASLKTTWRKRLNNKVETYIGFAIKKGSVVFGCDYIEKYRKKIRLVLYTGTLSDNSLSVLKAVSGEKMSAD